MQNNIKYNRLSIILLILSVLGFGGGLFLGILSLFIPYWKIIFLVTTAILLVVSFYQIFSRNERGVLFNLISTFSVVYGFAILNSDFVNWMNNDLARYKEEGLLITNVVIGICLIIAIVHFIFEKIRKYRARM